jgi:sirohydrochlorin ferrochelatase
MSRPVLLAVAHGSRDPRAQAAIQALAARVSALAPGVDVRAAFVQHAQPSLPGVLAAAGLGRRGTGHPTDAPPAAGQPSLAGALAEARPDRGGTGHPTDAPPTVGQPDGGQDRRPGVTIVPLLLAAGYHLTQDIGAAATPAGVPVAGPLGPDPRLVTALADRLDAAGTPARAPVVLAAAGSADPRALAAARRQAVLLAAHRQAPVLAAFAAAGRPTVAEAVTALAGLAAAPVAVAAYLLTPGQFHDRLAGSGARWVSTPLADHPAVAALVLDRYLVAAGQADPHNRGHDLTSLATDRPGAPDAPDRAALADAGRPGCSRHAGRGGDS